MNNYVALAQLWVALAEFMDEGHSFDEFYAQAIELSPTPALRELWQEMRACAKAGTGSPLDLMGKREDVVPAWFFHIFLSGMTTGIPTMWAYGGNAYLDATEMTADKAFKKLLEVAVDCGLDKDDAPQVVSSLLK